MTSISIPRETAAFLTAAHEPLTGRIPAAWTTGRDDETQSATFRALAWSRDDDLVAEPIPYVGEDYAASEAESRETVQIGEGAAGPPLGPRFGRAALLYGIAAGFAAFAVGGLLLTVVNADITPTTTSATVIQPVMSPLSPQPNRPAAPTMRAATPTRVVPPAATTPQPSNTPRPVVDPPVLTGTAITPDAPTEPQVATPQVATPEVATPQVLVPPLVATPEVAPPVQAPPVFTPPIVSVPEVTPQQVPHPVGPPVFRVPTVQDVGVSLPQVISVPAAPAAPIPAGLPVISVPAAAAVPNAPVIPTPSLAARQ